MALQPHPNPLGFKNVACAVCERQKKRYNETHGESVLRKGYLTVVLRLFQTQGWEGVWVDSYRRKYRVGLPEVVEPTELPSKQKQLLENIKSHTGKNGGCWDIFVWKNNQALFIELKRFKKDRIQNSQNSWLEASLALDLKPENFVLIEWDLCK